MAVLVEGQIFLALILSAIKDPEMTLFSGLEASEVDRIVRGVGEILARESRS